MFRSIVSITCGEAVRSRAAIGVLECPHEVARMYAGRNSAGAVHAQRGVPDAGAEAPRGQVCRLHASAGTMLTTMTCQPCAPSKSGSVQIGVACERMRNCQSAQVT